MFPLVERALRYEIAERITAKGDILLPLGLKPAFIALAMRMIEEGIEAVAILLLHCLHQSRSRDQSRRDRQVKAQRMSL